MEAIAQIPIAALESGQWYIGRGRNGNVGVWDSELECFQVLAKVGLKIGPGSRDWVQKWGIKQEPYFTTDSGCFQPFLLVDNGVAHELLKGSDGDRGYAKTLYFDHHLYETEQNICKCLADFEENNTMPIISMFYGIIIRLYLIDNQHHNLPHIHAKYAEFEASIGLDDGEILAGDLPRKQLRLVQAWIELHRDELMADWELAVSGENPYKIEPL